MLRIELYLILLLVMLLTNHASLGINWSGRTWQTDLNYGNPRNWVPARVPCSTDRVVFKTLETLVLQLPPGQTSLGELVLSEYVELVLPTDGNIQFTSVKQSANCEGQDIVFKHMHALRWTDTRNWDRWNKATPDLERVPCATEAVRFPSGNTYNIITPPLIKLGSTEVNGVSMDSFDWYEYLNNEDGVRQFHKSDGDSPEIEVSGNPCKASDWCQCGNEYLHSKICKSACPLALCKQPVKAFGFCCPFCGAYFLLGSKSQDKHRLTEHINSILENKVVVWHASKVREFIQVVLVEQEDYSGQISDISEDLKNSIVNSGLGWTVEEFHASGHVWYPITFTQVAGHFLSLMVLAAVSLAAIIVFYSKNWSWLQFSPSAGRPFVFARFENTSGELLVAHEPRQPSLPNITQAFDNPMYGATGQEKRGVTVENPVYTDLEAASENIEASEAVILNS